MARKYCEESDVPINCLGLCALSDAMARSIPGESLNSCAKHRSIIERCFQPVIVGDPEKELFDLHITFIYLAVLNIFMLKIKTLSGVVNTSPSNYEVLEISIFRVILIIEFDLQSLKQNQNKILGTKKKTF